MEKFAERLRELRREKKLSVEGLAATLSLSSTAISFWENGRRVPLATAVVALAKFFGVTADYLLGLED